MKDILETIIRHLVKNQDAIEITEASTDSNVTTYEVKVASEDMGRVIGKQGKTAKSIRTVMKSIAAKDKKRINIEFLD